MSGAADTPSTRFAGPLADIGRRVRCVHCRNIEENVSTPTFVCSCCGRVLETQAHRSPRLDAHLGLALEPPDRKVDDPSMAERCPPAPPSTPPESPSPASGSTFRGDFTFRNSPATVRRAPFPFDADSYRHAIGMRRHVPGPSGTALERPIDLDEHYEAELHERALSLAADPLRCRSLPHMALAGWDTLELLMACLAEGYPERFRLTRSGEHWHWTNRALGIEQRFRFGDAATLPHGPLEYITRQVQGDYCLLDEREGNLWLDAGTVTSASAWSFDFDLGMSFAELHAPVPRAPDSDLFDRALRYLRALRTGTPVRRLNWAMTVDPRLDTSLESYPEWGPERRRLTPADVADRLFLRIELQSFWRLPRSNAILFPIRTYLLSLRDLSAVPKWAARMHRVLKGLPPELSSYKGLDGCRETAVEWLARYDDGSPTTPGPRPD